MDDGRDWKALVAGLVALDIIALVLAFALAGYVRSAGVGLPAGPPIDPGRYGIVVALLVPLLLVLFKFRGLYEPRNLLGGPGEYARVVNTCTYGLIVVIGISYLYGEGPLVSRGWLLFSWLFAVILVAGGRFWLRRLAYYFRRRGRLITPVLVAGANAQGVAIAQQLNSPRGLGVRVVGFLDDYLPVGTLVVTPAPGRSRDGAAPVSVLGCPGEALDLARQLGVPTIIVVPQALAWESLQQLMGIAGRSETVEVRLAPTPYDLMAGGIMPAPLGRVPLLSLEPARIRGVEAYLKTFLDYTVAVSLLVPGLPLMGLLAAIARLRQQEPILERCRLIGQGSRPITLYLLSRRVTQLLILRGMPALINVLRGEMSLVGPRPQRVEEMEASRRWNGVLLSVRPGLTGPWRLAEADLPLEQRVAQDLWYIRNYTIWQDLFVLFQSARNYLQGVGAEHGLGRWSIETPSPGAAKTDHLELGRKQGLPPQPQHGTPPGDQSLVPVPRKR